MCKLRPQQEHKYFKIDKLLYIAILFKKLFA
jgi:hypothetical protein